MNLTNLTLADLSTLRLTGYDHDNAVCDYIRETIRTFDPRFDVAIDNDTEEIVVFHNGTIFQRTPCKDFDRNTILHIGEMTWLNLYGDVLSEVEKRNEAIEKELKREQEYRIADIAKDIEKYSQKL